MSEPKAHFRDALFQRDAIDVEKRTVELAFASEAPVERFGYVEILDCSERSVRLERLRDAAALLVDHNWKDQVGVVESVSFGADRKGRAVVRFGKSARASEIFTDVVDGIRTKVSFGYWIHQTKTAKRADGTEEVLATDWEPFEISLVSVPADHGVGVGRSAEPPVTETTIAAPAAEERSMSETNPAQPTAEVRAAIAAEVRNQELARISQLEEIGKAFARFDGEAMARAAITKGQSVEELRTQILEKVSKQPAPSADIGMSEREVQRFSFLRVLNALANPGDPKARAAAAFEFEASDAVSRVLGKSAQGCFVPNEVLQGGKRDLTVGTATAGGHTVATNLLASSFIDLLRNRLVLANAGATMLTGLSGNVAIPRQTGGATAYWVAESGAPTESAQAFDQVTLTPRTLGAYSDISRKLLLQSSIDVEAFVRGDLAKVVALEIDRAGLHGSGSSNQPTGVASVSGIGSVAGGTNGAAPTWANIIALETEIAQDNADIGSLAYVTNAKVRGKLKGTEKASSTGMYVWGEGASPLNGYRALVSNQVSSALTKGTANGVCSAIFFGNWADLLIGMWGGLDLTVDPYTASTTGTVRIVALQDVDVAVRHAESFAAMLDALTT